MDSEKARDPEMLGAEMERIPEAALKPLTGLADQVVPARLKVIMVPLHLVVEHPNGQARRMVEKLPFEDLKAAIRKQGFTSTVGLRRIGEKFEIIFGHRRIAALRELGGDAVPAFIWDELTEAERLVIQREENALRESLTAIEEAEESKRIHVALGGSKEETAKTMNISPQALGERLRIAGLPAEIIKVLHEKKVGRKHAGLLASLYVAIKGAFPKPEEAARRIIAITRRCVEEGWSSRHLATHCDIEKERAGLQAGTKKLSTPASSNPAPSAPAGPVESGALARWKAASAALMRHAEEGRMSAAEKAETTQVSRDISQVLRHSPLKPDTA
jgi:ParB/RepB/Spo0J family partition protein